MSQPHETVRIIADGRTPGSSEDGLWTPALNLRPHHLLVPQVRARILGQPIEPNHMDKQFINENYYDVRNYVIDTFGIGVPAESVYGETADAVSNLADNDILSLDINKDKICGSCNIGKHCGATNFTLYGRNYSRFAREQESIDAILNNLLACGFEEGSDFIFGVSTTELLDYGGENLYEATSDPVPVRIDFRSMLIKMAAVRTILQNWNQTVQT